MNPATRTDDATKRARQLAKQREAKLRWAERSRERQQAKLDALRAGDIAWPVRKTPPPKLARVTHDGRTYADVRAQVFKERGLCCVTGLPADDPHHTFFKEGEDPQHLILDDVRNITALSRSAHDAMSPKIELMCAVFLLSYCGLSTIEAYFALAGQRLRTAPTLDQWLWPRQEASGWTLEDAAKALYGGIPE